MFPVDLQLIIPVSYQVMEISDDIIPQLERLRSQSSKRLVVAVAGAPASGKTTLAHDLANRIPNCACVSMDGFHLDNPILKHMNLSDRKGSPETFDLDGFKSMIIRLKESKDIYVPVFDRLNEQTINCAHLIQKETQIVVVEGNYLLLDEPDWCELKSFWDYSIFLEVDLSIIERRLLDRWSSFDYTGNAAYDKVSNNDLPNAERVNRHRLPADITVTIA